MRASQELLPVSRSHQVARQYYNRISRIYDFLAEKSERRPRQMGLELLQPKPGERILEIGFGTGYSLVALAKAVEAHGKIFGIDISEGMLKIARSRLEREGLLSRVELNRHDAIPLPYPDSTLDAIFMSFTLELFDTPEIPKLLSECRRVLKSQGRIVVVGLSKEERRTAAVCAYEWAHEHFPNIADCRPIFCEACVRNRGISNYRGEENKYLASCRDRSWG